MARQALPHTSAHRADGDRGGHAGLQVRSTQGDLRDLTGRHYTYWVRNLTMKLMNTINLI